MIDTWLQRINLNITQENLLMFTSPKKKRGITLSLNRKLSSPNSSQLMHQSLVRVVGMGLQRVDSEKINLFPHSSNTPQSNKPRIIFSYNSKSSNLSGGESSKSLSKSNQNITAGAHNDFMNQNTVSFISSFGIDLPKQSLTLQHHQESKDNRQQANTYSNKILFKNPPLNSTPGKTDKAKLEQVYSANTLQQNINYACVPYAQVINLRKKRLEIRREVNVSSSPVETKHKNVSRKQQTEKIQHIIKSEKYVYQVKNKEGLGKPSRKEGLCNLLKMQSKLKDIIQICDSKIK